MRGTLLDFSVQKNKGYISGDNDNRYSFAGTEWQEADCPIKGDRLDFDIDALGNVIKVYKVIQHTTSVENQQIEKKLKVLQINSR